MPTMAGASAASFSQSHSEDHGASNVTEVDASPQGKTDGAHRLGTSVAYKGKACGISVPIQRLAGNDLKVPFRSLVPIPDVPTIEADYQLLAGAARRGSSQEFCRLLKPPAYLHRSVTDGAGGCLGGQREKLAEEVSDLSKRLFLPNPSKRSNWPWAPI